MRTAVGAIVILLLAAPVSARGGAEEARAALADARYGAALEALEDEPDELVRARIESDVFWYARDYDGCVHVAEAALARGVSDAHLAWRAAGAAIWMRRADPADDWTTRLEDDIEAGAGVRAAEAPWWREQAESYRRMASEIRDGDRARDAAKSLAQRVSLGLLGLATTAFLVLVLGRRTERVPAAQP